MQGVWLCPPWVKVATFNKKQKQWYLPRITVTAPCWLQPAVPTRIDQVASATTGRERASWCLTQLGNLRSQLIQW